MSPKIPQLSAIILAKDEKDRIAECIRSVSFCDEVIVIDNGSVDETISIAKNSGARVIKRSSTSFATLRNYGKEVSLGEWIFYVDADELVSHELRASVLKVLDQTSIVPVAYRVTRINSYFGVEFKDVEHMVRLIKRSALLKWEGMVHETPVIDGKVGDLDGVLRHDTHRTLTHMVEKTNVWSAVEAKLRFDSSHPPVVWWRILRVMFTGFYDSYITRGGWRVGKAGFIESIYQSFSMFITYAKLYELQQKNKNEKSI